MAFFRSKKKIIVIAILVVAVAGGIFIYGKQKSSKTVSTNIETTAKVTKGSIKIEISGSGVIEPIQSYDITPLVNGKILSAPFEEGQSVKKDDILYKIDATEAEGNIQKTQNSISKLDLNSKEARDSINKSVVYADRSGILTNFTIKENETIASNKIGEITDNSYCVAKVPFSQAQISQIKVGQSATVNSSALMSSISGTVSKVSTYSSKKSSGVVLYDVEITINGSNALIKDTDVTAVIGNMESPEAGKIYAPDSYSIISSVTGRVRKVYASNNDYIEKGQKILEFDSDTYSNTLVKNNIDRNDFLITLDTYKKQLENYNIKSPIDGTVLQKSKKAGDTIGVSSNSQNLMIVVDMSKVKFDMKIDELDINKLKIGQTVNVTADAVADKIFVGKITSIAGKGTAANGVSNYLVQVTIDQPGDLKPGMNVSAKTVVAEKNDILMVPASAITKKDGKTFVNLPKQAAETGKTEANTVNVDIGINNKDYIEIVNGLNEGDTIVIPTNVDEKNGVRPTMNLE